MQNPDLWQKEFKRETSYVLISILLILFLLYEFCLFSRLFSERDLDYALYYLEKARQKPKELILEKSLAYQNALKLLLSSVRINQNNARANFSFAEAIAEINQDPQLINSLEIRNFGGLEDTQKGYFHLAEANYKKAILKEPTNAIYHQRLGDTYLKLLDYQQTEEEFTKAILLDPQNLSLHLYLSQYYLSRDNQEKFRYHLKQTRELANLVGHYEIHGVIENFLKALKEKKLIVE